MLFPSVNDDRLASCPWPTTKIINCPSGIDCIVRFRNQQTCVDEYGNVINNDCTDWQINCPVDFNCDITVENNMIGSATIDARNSNELSVMANVPWGLQYSHILCPGYNMFKTGNSAIGSGNCDISCFDSKYVCQYLRLNYEGTDIDHDKTTSIGEYIENKNTNANLIPFGNINLNCSSNGTSLSVCFKIAINGIQSKSLSVTAMQYNDLDYDDQTGILPYCKMFCPISIVGFVEISDRQCHLRMDAPHSGRELEMYVFGGFTAIDYTCTRGIATCLTFGSKMSCGLSDVNGNFPTNCPVQDSGFCTGGVCDYTTTENPTNNTSTDYTINPTINPQINPQKNPRKEQKYTKMLRCWLKN